MAAVERREATYRSMWGELRTAAANVAVKRLPNRAAPLSPSALLLGGAVQVDPGISQSTPRLLSSVDTKM